MQIDPRNPQRRACVVQIGRAAALVAAVLLDAASSPASAKAAKSDFGYRDRSRDGKSCSGCKFFTPDTNAIEVGSCAVVEGVVRSTGWCMAFAPKRQ